MSNKYPKGSFIVRNGKKCKVLEEIGELRFISIESQFENWETEANQTQHILELEREGWKVEEPKEEWPKEGDAYWTINFGFDPRDIAQMIWENHGFEHKRLKLGLVFRTQEEAQAWFDKVFGKENV